MSLSITDSNTLTSLCITFASLSKQWAGLEVSSAPMYSLLTSFTRVIMEAIRFGKRGHALFSTRPQNGGEEGI